MRHTMKLRSQPFHMIRSGQKTFELRLYDEKRQKLHAGDEIEFSCLEGNEVPFVVRVTRLHLFKAIPHRKKVPNAAKYDIMNIWINK